MKKRFGRSKVNFKKFSKRHFLISVLIGLVAAFVIYSFSSVLREALRLMTLHDGLEPLIVDEGKRYLYNLFFAALSLIYGSSVTIALFFSKQCSLLPRRSNKRKRILNDQVFLNANFAYVFFQLLTSFGVFYFGEVYQNFLKEEFTIVAIILLLVLFLESWKNLIQVLGQRRWILQFIHLIVIVLLSLGLSNINIVDYKSIDENLLKNNPIVSKPNSEYFSEITWRYRVIKFKLTSDKNGGLIIDFNKKRIELNDVASQIKSERASLREEVIPFLHVWIIADKNLDLIKIKQFEAELFAIGQLNIIYEVAYGDFNSRSSFFGIVKRINRDVIQYFDSNSSEILVPPTPYFNEIISSDTIRLQVSSKKKVDSKAVSKEELTKIFKNNVSKGTAFQYDITSDSSYQDYIDVLSIHYEVVEGLRKKEQTISKTNLYQRIQGFREEQSKLKEKYPIIIFEKYID